MSIGAIRQIASFGVPQMIVGRIIAGIGNGINTSTAPVWQGETSKASWRGKLIVIEMIMNIAGFSLSNWVTYGFSYAAQSTLRLIHMLTRHRFVGGSAAWRVPLAFQFLFIIILFATVPWLPESPRWLMAQGRTEEAEKILADLESTDVTDPYVVIESKDIQWAVQYEKDHAVRWRDLLRGRTGDQGGTHTIRRLFLDMGSQAMQQLSGINICWQRGLCA
jgi:MFS family permease